MPIAGKSGGSLGDRCFVGLPGLRTLRVVGGFSSPGDGAAMDTLQLACGFKRPQIASDGVF
ncbi:hypothetical protein SALB1_1751 [Salinisphaera sp. LB1]|nr:hypothetical protein SALB1_1751 [Salinisphaera sp. LB1]